MRLKKILTAGCIFAALLGLAESARAWTFTATGVIGFGYDKAGTFGPVGDLTGKRFTQVYTIDPEAFPLQIGDGNMAFGGGKYQGKITQTITIEGVSKTFQLNKANGRSSLENNKVLASSSAYQSINGHILDGAYFYSTSYLVSINEAALGNTVSFDQSFIGKRPAYYDGIVKDPGSYTYGESVFYLYDTNKLPATYFRAGGELTITVNQAATAANTKSFAFKLVGLNLSGTASRTPEAKPSL